MYHPPTTLETLQILSTRDYKALSRGTLGVAGLRAKNVHGPFVCLCVLVFSWLASVTQILRCTPTWTPKYVEQWTSRHFSEVWNDYVTYFGGSR